MVKLGLGIDVFENYITESEMYVDKTLFIKDVIDNTNQVLLITRPRRFGKTLNMTMLKAFFEIKDKPVNYFTDLNIWKCTEEYTSHYSKHPVIFMTLKGMDSNNWEDCLKGLKNKVALVFEEYKFVRETLSESQKVFFDNILFKRADEIDFASSIGELIKWLHNYYGERVILLIDEYDAPLNDGFNKGFAEDIVVFMRNMFSNAMKSNPSINKAIMTGLTKIAGKSLFSTLNHFKSYNVTENKFSQYFGFTKEEAKYALEKCEVVHTMDEISKWYNGYTFGNTTEIYNPWSIMNVCDSPTTFLKSYWRFTASENSLGKVINNISPSAKEKIYDLLNGAKLELPLHDDVTFETVQRNSDVLWTFLLYAGYLTSNNQTDDSATFFIPNYEVRKAFEATLERWIIEPSTGSDGVNNMLIAMLKGKEELFAKKLKQYVVNAFSFFDVAYQYPERVYHAFILGLLCHVQETYYVSSNPEAGEGRADILIMPKAGEFEKTAVILEFKETDEKEKLQSIAEKALVQIKSKEYINEAKKRGAKDIYIYGIGFCGRDTKVIMEKTV